MRNMFVRVLLALVALTASQVVLAHDPPAYATVEPSHIPSNFNVGDFIVPNALEPDQHYPTKKFYDEGAFRTICESSHLSYDDPVLFPGQDGVSHLHDFYGNTLTDENSNYTSLRTTGESTCGGGKLNRSGYWHPAVLKDNCIDSDADGQVDDTCAIKAAYAVVYYKTNRDTVDGLADHSHRVPRGLAYVFGFNMSTGAKGSFVGWKCMGGPQAGALFDSLADVNGNATFNCPAGELLGAEISGPACWNGTQLTTLPSGRSHMAGKINNGHNAPCPGTHPYRIPHFDFIIWFSHNGPDDYKHWYLSSDRMPDYPRYLNGQSMHADWLGAWDYPIMQLWMNECNGLTLNVEDIRSCHSTQFGDGTAGLSTGIDLAPLPESERYRALPVDDQQAPPGPDPVEGHKSGHKVRHRHVH